MTPRLLALLLCLCAGARWTGASAQTPAGQARAFDYLIRGGLVVDGTGASGFVGDVALSAGRVARVSRMPLDTASAWVVVDARGMVVAPGFIDSHAHVEQLDRRPLAESFLRQGVTTVIYAADGGQPWPLDRYIARLDSLGHAPNIAFYAGHNTIRTLVMGTANRAPTPVELERMRSMVDQAMREGAVGLSSGLRYVPANYATTEEVIALAQVAARHGGIYSAHMRDEGEASVASVNEMIRIGREAGLPVQVTHHKLMGQAQWGQSVQTLALVDSARARGQDVTIDQYPYDATSTAISTIFPPWSLAGGADSLRARLADPATKAKIVAGIEATIVRERGGGDLSRIQLASYGANHAWDGETFADVLKARGQAQDLADAAALAIEIQMHGGAQGVWHVVDEADIRRIMTYPWTMFSSDGEIGVLDHAHPHPRNYGATARILGRYVRGQKVLPLEEAVRKLTSLPAWRFGQMDRGTLAEGQWGDVVVFDPARVRDLATYADPHRFSVGVEYVWVNGVPVLTSNSLTGARPGRVLRREFPAGAEAYRYTH
ncbi:MAG TPA: D-aminoacylase [Longimicrobiales bacterium]